MTLRNKIASLFGASAILLLTAMFGLSTTASADCIYQYNPNGFPTSSTPVFNKICGVPGGVGDESNFVRIRPDVTGNDEDNNSNPAYSIGTINSACNSGSKYDVWNYVHNDATQAENPDVGSGSAVSLGTYINMTAPINTTNDSFSFSGTVGNTGNLTGTAGATSTTNMTPAVLDCNGNRVQLSIVPGSVNEYSIPYGQWENNSQNGAALNTNLPIGSTNTGGINSGTQWGCWTYRIVIVYQVQVTPIPVQTTPPTCNFITADQTEIEKVSYTANSANVTGYNFNIYSGSSASGTPLSSSGNVGLTLPYLYSSFPNLTLNEGHQYTVTAAVTSSNFANVSSAGCSFTFTTPKTPPTPTPTPTPTVTPTAQVTSLTNTGPGSVVAIFAAVSLVASGIYYWVLRRHLAKK